MYAKNSKTEKGNTVMESVLHGTFGRVSLGKRDITIGQATNNHIVIDDARVAAYHACIRSEATGYSITDLGTPGGTYLNGVRLKSYIPYVLHHFDTICIGNTTCLYEIVTLTPSFVSTGLRYLPLIPTIRYPAPWQPLFRASPGLKLLPLHFSRPLIVATLLGIALTLGLLAQLALAVSGWIQNFTAAHTLYTYCTALKSQNYTAAYAHLDSDSQHTLRLADFVYIIQRPTGMSTIVNCHVTAIHIVGTFARGRISYKQSDGTTFTVDYILRKQGHSWKISHLTASTSDLLLATYCYALARQAYALAYTLWSTSVRRELTVSAFTHRLHALAITACTATTTRVSATHAFAIIAYTMHYASSQLYFVDLLYDEGRWWIDGQRSFA